ncbi:hypothetical protein RchiOBHm_Chr4g0432311 [Rosa chinensis]|uniref:Uncharacterized protein n=1 Tax=Rosa chinensis TaxID=74649 RepID=A0A2P6R0Y2_ROSCH|nr:hypothetical protein RchiOBHm_Chr4g0432311 [Rosa chinensis]
MQQLKKPARELSLPTLVAVDSRKNSRKTIKDPLKSFSAQLISWRPTP